METVYVVGRIIEENILRDDICAWVVIGVFTEKTMAEAACKSNMDFVGPIELNVINRIENVDWPGAYFPRR